MPTTLIDPIPRIVLGLTAWMAVWWVTEPVPIPVTSFLPMIVLQRAHHDQADGQGGDCHEPG